MKKLKKTFNAFRILDNWKLVIEKNNNYSGQCFLNTTKRIAIICTWKNEETSPPDFELHEILHIAFAELFLMDRRKQKELIIAEEKLIQDICKHKLADSALENRRVVDIKEKEIVNGKV